jgi:hypothetical protein
MKFKTIRQVLLTSVITIGNILTLIPIASAQTADPYVNELLRQSQAIIQERARNVQPEEKTKLRQEKIRLRQIDRKYS